MFNLGMPELIVIFIVALLVFGPKKLPELGKSLGRAMSEFKRSSQEFRDSLESEVEVDKIKKDLAKEQRELKDSLNPLADKPAGSPEKTGSKQDDSPYAG